MVGKASQQVTLSSWEGVAGGSSAPFPLFYSVWNPSPWNSAAHIRWIFLLQLRLPEITQRGFHGDSKSYHFNNEDWQSQSQPCQLDLQTHKAIRAFHPLPQSPVSTSYCSISKSSIAFRSPDTFETREKFLPLRACKIKKNKQQNKSYTSNEIWQSSHFHCKRGEHRHS